MSTDIDSEVVGFVYYVPGKGMFCDDNSCLIVESATSMRKYIRANVSGVIDPDDIMEVYFGVLTFTIEAGEPYVFNLPAYQRFYALAQQAGKSWDLINPDAVCSKLVHVKMPINKTSV